MTGLDGRQSSGKAASTPLNDTPPGATSPPPTVRVRDLPTAKRAPVSVRPGAPLRTAIPIMLQRDFSQLPLMTSSSAARDW